MRSDPICPECDQEVGDGDDKVVENNMVYHADCHAHKKEVDRREKGRD